MRRPPALDGGVAIPGLLDPGTHRLDLCAPGLVTLLIVALVALAGCGRSGPPARYAQVLYGPEDPSDVAVKIEPPSADCMREAVHAVERPSDILESPLPPDVQRGYAKLVRGLPDLAKQVLRRTGGIWFARHMPGASARFIPCNGRKGTGLILVDLDANPLEDSSRDVDIPIEYWRLLGGDSEAVRARQSLAALRPDHPAARYVVLHEIGHALSLLSGEFLLTAERQFELVSWTGYAAYSWRGRRVGALGRDLHHDGGVVPTGLRLGDWRDIRRSLGSSSTWLAPGYRRSNRLGAMRHCHVADRLPRAGFVTPTAATAPTEDYAELFAHAVLAAEGKIHPEDVVRVQVPGCEPELQPAPYFATGLADKRAYMEHHLGIRAMFAP
jgi:Prokaryotic lipoprotein-attachment site